MYFLIVKLALWPHPHPHTRTHAHTTRTHTHTHHTHTHTHTPHTHTQLIYRTCSEFGMLNHELETDTYKAIEERSKMESSYVDLKMVGQH